MLSSSLSISLRRLSPCFSRSISYGSYSMKGLRPQQEDSYLISSSKEGENMPDLIAVFDGHCGHETSAFLSDHLGECFSHYYTLFEDKGVQRIMPFGTSTQLFAPYHHTSCMDLSVGKIESMLYEQGLGFAGSTLCALQLHDLSAYIPTEEEEEEEEKRKDSTTLFVGSNVGDSRAICITLNEEDDIRVFTKDHKPENPSEKERIEAMGGFIKHHGCWRVNGNLAMSRAVGDFPLKPFVNSALDHTWGFLPKGESFCILGTDGLYDTMTNEQVKEAILEWRAEHDNSDEGEGESMSHLAQFLAKRAYKKGSSDNITVAVAYSDL